MYTNNLSDNINKNSDLGSTSLTVIILTYNEQLHIKRCIDSVRSVAERVIIIDSYSTDHTLEIARSLGAEIFQNPFIHQAQQFQWALDSVPVNSDWIMRIDADEYILPSLAEELNQKLPVMSPSITGLYVNRRVYFLDSWIKRGYYPMRLLRVWRNGAGYVQQKWMDEHIYLHYGEVSTLSHDMADHNLNSLTWWTAKHNDYATREAIDRLNREFHFLSENFQQRSINISKKWYKSIYLHLPLFLRPFLYFFYRYIFRLGILEGIPGLIWHILQGFWYQFLVDAKIYQIKHLAKKNNKTVQAILAEQFNIKI